MLIGVPKEIKVHEYRVGLTPESVRALVAGGHRVLVEKEAGEGIGAADADYRAAGAAIAETAEEVFAAAELIVKVKEPLAPERARLRPGQAIFTYLHLAPDADQTRELVQSGAIGIAYETVTAPDGGLPLLAPMSVVAGRMAVQVAAHYLERPHGGRGVLIPGAAGVPPARVLILGAGVVGSNAALIALGMGGEVTVLNRSTGPLQRLAAQFGPRVKTGISTPGAIAAQLRDADAVIGAALVPGALAPKLVTRGMLAGMKRGAVMVDVSIDQGGCFETSRPTTHADPVYTVDGVIHYCVANMPGAVPRTSTYALNHATLPFVMELAGRGVVEALKQNEHLRNGLNVCRGAVTRREVAAARGYPYTGAVQALGNPG
ncbi:MAG: alanine dehydrogenase [Betaproteobacteria bacterium RIFCSPLOWO2_02_FULL_67_26]|nr:MAG: alanine dehydrogenase [Betaproteobacteria bacterium RIFCSPLOWO2_02_FULL_67_26]